MVFISSAAANGFTGGLVPITNLTGNLGLTARRWANVFGGTLTITNTATIGGTLTVNGAGTHSFNGTLNAASLIASDITLAAGIIDTLTPAVDNTGSVGQGGPAFSGALRYAGANLSGLLATAKGADLASGTTLSFGVDGNYFDVTGTATIAGISYAATLQDPQAGIFNFVHLDSNPTFTHHATRLQMSGATDFVGRTNDHLALISDGSGSWREAFRSYRPLAYGSCTSALTSIAWTQAAAAQNTWYQITDTDMADGILSLVAHDGSGRLTVTNDGVYKIAYTASIQSDAANHVLQTSLFITGAGNSSGGGMAQAVTASVYYQLTGTAIIRLAAGATIDVDIRTITAGAPTLTVGFLDLTAVQVGW
jgi:hypothetical protein